MRRKRTRWEDHEHVPGDFHIGPDFAYCRCMLELRDGLGDLVERCTWFRWRAVEPEPDS